MSSSGYRWKKLKRAERQPPREELVQAWMAQFNCDRAEALRRMAAHNANSELWVNDLYQVEVTRNAEAGMAHLNIRRRDGYPSRDWRHFQQIKNEIVGPECEAIEVYPAESRLVDTSNKYHLYAVLNPEFRFPVGWGERAVEFPTHDVPGMRQRPPMQFEREREEEPSEVERELDGYMEKRRTS